MTYFNGWSNADEVRGSFEIDAATLRDVTIRFASYDCAYYEGDALVILVRDGKLYEVNGSHCSCYGLEGQWSEEETTVEALRVRLETEWFAERHGDDVAAALADILANLESEGF